MGPMYATITTFCVATHIATNIRNKDDETNYAFGGFCAGVMYGVLIKQKLFGLWAGLGCALFGAIKKNSKLNNWEFYPEDLKFAKPVHGDFRTPYANFTLYDQRPRGWIAAEQRQE